jgi:hypothetical protein
MPWDAPLTQLQTDLTGQTATALSLIGIVAVFGVLIFGGELNHFFRSMCYLILLISVLVAGQNILGDLGITGATVSGPVLWLSWSVIGIIAAAALGLAYALGHRHGQRKAVRAAEAVPIPLPGAE